jgi:anthranilate phosphoribosyltransferase
MANPAGVRHQLIGVFDPAWARPVAETLAQLGTQSAWVVHSQGLDELTLAGETQVVALKNNEITSFTLNPSDSGLPPVPLAEIAGGDAAQNAAALHAVLHGARNGYRNTILFNAAAALIVAGATASLADGAGIAADAIDSGRAADILARLIEASREQVRAGT